MQQRSGCVAKFTIRVMLCGALRRAEARQPAIPLQVYGPHELLQGHLARRKIETGVLDYKEPEKAAGQSVRQKVMIREGIDKELAKRLVKDIKGSGLKVQVAIQGDELRVSGKKRDDLQAVIQFVRGLNIEQPLQYENFRD